jgi:hypothetical protein
MGFLFVLLSLIMSKTTLLDTRMALVKYVLSNWLFTVYVITAAQFLLAAEFCFFFSAHF